MDIIRCLNEVFLKELGVFELGCVFFGTMIFSVDCKLRVVIGGLCPVALPELLLEVTGSILAVSVAVLAALLFL